MRGQCVCCETFGMFGMITLFLILSMPNIVQGLLSKSHHFLTYSSKSNWMYEMMKLHVLFLVISVHESTDYL